MKLQQVLSHVRKAVDDYAMIQDGDVIAVGISGGKDSLTLLYALSKLRMFYPHPFQIKAITIDLGFHNVDMDAVKNLCLQLDIEYVVKKTNIADIVFQQRQESNPCSLCAKMRKGSLNAAISKMGCNKVAYAHHKDDLIETMLLSLFYEGRFHSFSPVTHLDTSGITVIRPLIYMSECDIIGFVNKYNIAIVKSACPVDGHTKRQYIKDLVRQLNKENPGIKQRMFHAIVTGNFSDWPVYCGKEIRYRTDR